MIGYRKGTEKSPMSSFDTFKESRAWRPSWSITPCTPLLLAVKSRSWTIMGLVPPYLGREVGGRQKPSNVHARSGGAGNGPSWRHFATRSWRPASRPASEAGSSDLLRHLWFSALVRTQATWALALRIPFLWHQLVGAGRVSCIYCLITSSQ